MYLLSESKMRALAQSALKLDALEQEGVYEWPSYWDAMVDYNIMEYDEKEDCYEYTSKVDELMDTYNVEVPIINDLLDLMSLIDHKIDIYEQKTTQFADGVQSALIFVKVKLEEIVNGTEYK
ncbi:MAG: hypothetical protein E7167_01320 [Firmicutes bacterium]|nr:hypothetical protein [Bacillota bacterium]